MALLAKNKLHSIIILIFKGLVGSYINHDEFVSVNNVLREYDEIKEEIENCAFWKSHVSLKIKKRGDYLAN